MSIKLQIVMENTSYSKNLFAEHGLSVYIEADGLKFIFDCGQSELTWQNAKTLQIDLSKLNFAVISHAHYDHAGGFATLPIKPKILYTGNNFWLEKFSAEKYRGAGFKFENLRAWQVEQKICHDILQLSENIFLIGNFERTFDFETIAEKFVRGANKLPDNFDDEICLAIKKAGEIILLAGCSHAGILNIISTVQARLNLPVKTLIGGVHLIEADDFRIVKTLTHLKNFGVEDFYFCHCSGVTSKNKIAVGSILEF